MLVFEGLEVGLGLLQLGELYGPQESSSHVIYLVVEVSFLVDFLNVRSQGGTERRRLEDGEERFFGGVSELREEL